MKKTAVCAFLFVAFMILVSQVKAAPTSYIDEEINGHYFMNGTLEELTKRGYVSVIVGNDKDVLQYIEMTLSSTDNTDLASPIAYRATASSPYGDDKTRLFLNTTESPESLYYNILKSTPLINVSLQYQNKDGGKDLHHGDNTLNFRIILNANLTDVSLNLQVRKDVYQGKDAMNIVNPTATSYKDLRRRDTDNDGVYDNLKWTGDINGEVQIIFDGEITPGVNFDENQRFVNLAGECLSTYTQNSDFTGIKFENRFSRGPVRQGIDMIKTREGGWTVRSFIKDTSSDLKYKVDKWEIYEVGNKTPVASSSSGFELNPGDIYYTNFYPVGEKKYFSSSYDWKIVWGESFYNGKINSEVELPTLYEIDSDLAKSIVIEKNDQTGRELTITDRVRHIGSSKVSVNKVKIYSKIPSKSNDGSSTSWDVSNVKVLKRVGPDTYDITSQATITTKNTDGGDGYVDLDLTLSKPLNQNDDIILTYTVTSQASSQEQNYTFSTNSTLITESGTPDKRFLEQFINIPAVAIQPPPPPPPSGAAAPPKKESAGIFKEDSRAYVIGNIGYLDITYKVFDTGTKGIRDDKLMILVPERGELEENSINIYRNKEWKNLTIDKDYEITDMGVVQVGEKKYHQYLIGFKEKLNMYDGEKLRIRYTVSLPQGKNEIITKMSGYNYYEDKIISEEVHSLVMVQVHVTKLTVVERNWKQQRAFVGEPVVWIKDFQLENSNDFVVEDYFTTETFKDVVSVYLVEDGKEKKLQVGDSKARWPIRVEPHKKKFIRLKAFTPPVIEIHKNVQPLSKEGGFVVLKINSTIKNFAMEDYKNVTYVIYQPKKNIIGYENIELLDRRNETWGLWDVVFSGQTKKFTITYKQEPPILIVRLNGYNFTQKETADVDVVVIPKENTGGYIEMGITGPNQELVTRYADIFDVGNRPQEFNRKIKLEGYQPGEYKLDTSFKQDFATILSDKKKFYVTGEKIKEISYQILLLLLLIFILIMIKRIYKKKDRFEEELERLRKRLKEV